ncbi:transporter substrate-binding domain-containing protein [Pelagibius sp.]|uniref:transporter substrate-binding domain-containing protein n=1 Tax=Pelagibius sp. TaxID=1931238 RepID=UPI003BB0B457
MPRARSTGEPWRVGVLFSRTGFMKVIEDTQLRGTLTAIDEINSAGGINGRPIEPIVYDPGSESSAFGRYAKKLMVEDGVTTMFGCYTSSSRKAVLPVIERLNGLLWYPTLYEGFEFSPNVIYTGAAPNQNSVELCRFLMESYGTRFFFVGSDYVYPRASNRIMRELVRNNGGEVVGEQYLSLRAKDRDFLPVMREIGRVSPDVVFSTVVGDSTTYLYQAYADSGFNSKVMPIASLTTTEAEIGAMGPDVGEGHFTAAPYFEGISGARNSSFVELYKKRYGQDQHTNMCVEASYFQVHVFARALEQVDTLETETLRPVVLGSEYDAPQGKISINLSCAHTDLWTRIGKANRQGKFEVIRESSSRVDADPYLIGYGRSLVYG